MSSFRAPAAAFLLAAISLSFVPVQSAPMSHGIDLEGIDRSVTPGDDYHRFIPLMNAIPFWLQGMWVMSGMLFLASAWLLLRNNRAAFEFFVLALELELIAMMFEHAVPAYREAFSFSSPNFRRDVVIPVAQIVSPFLIAGVLWLMTRRVSTPRSN